MAVAVKPSQSLINIRSGIKSVRSSFSGLKKKTGKLNNILLRKTKVKRESIARNYILSQRRQEAEKRKNREDLIEALSIGGVIKRQAKAVASSTKGFLGRIMDFLGTLLVGWLLYNLPSIITMAQELIARMQRLSTIVSGFFSKTISIFRGFGNLLGAIGSNILTFDFTDSNNKVKNAMSDLGSNFEDMQSQFDEGFRLLTTSLGEGIVSGQDADPFGTKLPNQSMQEPSGPSGTPGSSGQLQPIHKQALDIISKPESGGDYNAMNRGRSADSLGGSKKWIGKNLTDMTIGEVKTLQRQNNPVRLHAAGRYQIVPGSLPTAQSAARLKDSDMFDNNNQDLLAIGLLKTQGPGAWSKYSRYSKEEISLMYKAKDTPLGKSQAPTPAQTTSTPAPTAINPNKKIALNAKVGATIKTDYFGSMGSGRTVPHGGIDLGCNVGTYISCKYPCRVVEASSQGGYGYYTDIIIPSLNIRLRFAHLSKQLIKSGEVPAGKPFAQSGNSGARITGPHIHMEATKNMNGTAYGGDFNPDPYVDAMIFSAKPPAGFAAPSTPSTPTPAQIASQGTQQRQQVSQQLKQQKNGPTIVVIEEDPPAQQQVSAGGGGGGGMIPIIINPLNSFITKKLLLDLAYT
jgi:hypothetical protein